MFFVLLALCFILIIFLIPRLYLGLYIWCFLVLYSIFSFPGSQRYMDKSGPDAFGEAILYMITLIVISSIIIRVAITLGHLEKYRCLLRISRYTVGDFCNKAINRGAQMF